VGGVQPRNRLEGRRAPPTEPRDRLHRPDGAHLRPEPGRRAPPLGARAGRRGGRGGAPRPAPPAGVDRRRRPPAGHGGLGPGGLPAGGRGPSRGGAEGRPGARHRQPDADAGRGAPARDRRRGARAARRPERGARGRGRRRRAPAAVRRCRPRSRGVPHLRGGRRRALLRPAGAAAREPGRRPGRDRGGGARRLDPPRPGGRGGRHPGAAADAAGSGRARRRPRRGPRRAPRHALARVLHALLGLARHGQGVPRRPLVRHAAHLHGPGRGLRLPGRPLQHRGPRTDGARGHRGDVRRPLPPRSRLARAARGHPRLRPRRRPLGGDPGLPQGALRRERGHQHDPAQLRGRLAPPLHALGVAHLRGAGRARDPTGRRGRRPGPGGLAAAAAAARARSVPAGDARDRRGGRPRRRRRGGATSARRRAGRAPAALQGARFGAEVARALARRPAPPPPCALRDRPAGHPRHPDGARRRGRGRRGPGRPRDVRRRRRAASVAAAGGRRRAHRRRALGPDRRRPGGRRRRLPRRRGPRLARAPGRDPGDEPQPRVPHRVGGGLPGLGVPLPHALRLRAARGRAGAEGRGLRGGEHRPQHGDGDGPLRRPRRAHGDALRPGRGARGLLAAPVDPDGGRLRRHRRRAARRQPPGRRRAGGVPLRRAQERRLHPQHRLQRPDARRRVDDPGAGGPVHRRQGLPPRPLDEPVAAGAGARGAPGRVAARGSRRPRAAYGAPPTGATLDGEGAR
jgi:hypothetical protein